MCRRYSSAPMPASQKYRLRARSDREIVREVEPGVTYVDHETGEEFQVVGALLPLAPSPSDLPYSVENLRLCGCSLEQLKDAVAETLGADAVKPTRARSPLEALRDRVRRRGHPDFR